MRRFAAWFRRGQAPVAAAAAEFDAAICLGPSQLPPGCDAARAVAAVRAAVQAVRGAGWIDVGYEAEEAPAARASWLRLFPAAPDRPVPPGRDAEVLDATRRALAGLAGRVEFASAEFPLAEAEPGLAWGGFAETGFADAQGFAPVAEPVSRRDAAADAAPAEVADAALLARLLGLVLRESADEVAARVLRRFGSFAAALDAPERDLREIAGLGTHSIAAIKLVHAASLRLARAGVMDRPVLEDWAQLIAYLTAILARERIEQFRILFLDDAARLCADEAQARGTVNHTPVYPREVVRRALELGAASIILVHNHPSGDPSPSRADIEMTRLIAEALRLVSIGLQDHVIVGNGRWLSFRREGLLPAGC